MAPANMWTRKDLKEFKEQIRKEKDAVIKVGSGETVTVGIVSIERSTGSTRLSRFECQRTKMVVAYFGSSAQIIMILGLAFISNGVKLNRIQLLFM